MKGQSAGSIVPLFQSLILAVALQQPVGAQTNRVVVPDPQDWRVNSRGNFMGQTDRPLRYSPVGRDFVITNGVEFFNRPL